MDEAKAVRESDVFQTIEKINKKIASLRSILSPVLNNVPESTKEEGFGTKLGQELHKIDNELARLIDMISL